MIALPVQDPPVPDPVFAPFTAQHGLTLVAGTAALTAILKIGKRGGDAERCMRALLAFLCLTAFPFTAWSWSQVQRATDLSNAAPLHLCDIAAFLAGFALITGNRTCATLTYFWGLAGTVQGIATPALDIGFPHPAYFSFFIQHFAIIGAAIYLPLVLGWRMERPFWKSPLVAFAWLNVYVVVAIIANRLLDTNFGFLSRPPDNPSVLNYLGPHPIYILWLELIALAFFALLALPVKARTPPEHAAPEA